MPAKVGHLAALKAICKKRIEYLLDLSAISHDNSQNSLCGFPKNNRQRNKLNSVSLFLGNHIRREVTSHSPRHRDVCQAFFSAYNRKRSHKVPRSPFIENEHFCMETLLIYMGNKICNTVSC